MRKVLSILFVFCLLTAEAQMTYEGRLTPNESRAWLYGSLSVFALILAFAYNMDTWIPVFRNFIRKIRKR